MKGRKFILFSDVFTAIVVVVVAEGPLLVELLSRVIDVKYGCFSFTLTFAFATTLDAKPNKQFSFEKQKQKLDSSYISFCGDRKRTLYFQNLTEMKKGFSCRQVYIVKQSRQINF